MGLVKSAAEILAGRPRPVDRVEPGPGKGRGGRPPLHKGCKLKPEGCDRKHWGHGYCRPHGRKFMLYGDPLWVPGQPIRCLCHRCPVHHPDSAAFQRANGYRATMGTKRGRRSIHTHCQVPGCKRLHHGRGMCRTCARKFDTWGDALHVYVSTGSGKCGCEKHKLSP